MNDNNLYATLLVAVLSPLLGAAITGLWGRWMDRRGIGAAWITIAGMAVSLAASLVLFSNVCLHPMDAHHKIFVAYTWLQPSSFDFHVGFWVDKLSVGMMSVVCFISFLVHLYSVGYMHGDKSYSRFFCYISFFTFCMLMLVGADNFLQLFFGWEGVGLASYLLIGFWYTRESALQGSLKAFLVNRVGDFGFLLGLARF